MSPGLPGDGRAAPRSMRWFCAAYRSSFLPPSLGFGGRGRLKRGNHIHLRELRVNDLESHRQVLARGRPTEDRRTPAAPARYGGFVAVPHDRESIVGAIALARPFIFPSPCPDVPPAWYTRLSPRVPATSRCVMAKRPSAEAREEAETCSGARKFGALAQGQKALVRQRLTMRQMTRHLAHHRCRLAQMRAVEPASRPHHGPKCTGAPPRFPRRSDIAQNARLMVTSVPRSVIIEGLGNATSLAARSVPLHDLSRYWLKFVPAWKSG